METQDWLILSSPRVANYAREYEIVDGFVSLGNILSAEAPSLFFFFFFWFDSGRG